MNQLKCYNFPPGICKDDTDLIRPGRITMKPTLEQNALVKACHVVSRWADDPLVCKRVFREPKMPRESTKSARSKDVVSESYVTVNVKPMVKSNHEQLELVPKFEAKFCHVSIYSISSLIQSSICKLSTL